VKNVKCQFFNGAQWKMLSSVTKQDQTNPSHEPANCTTCIAQETTWKTKGWSWGPRKTWVEGHQRWTTRNASDIEDVLVDGNVDSIIIVKLLGVFTM
jgi:hypothetical protein